MIVCARQIFNVPSAMLQAYRKTAWAARADARALRALCAVSNIEYLSHMKCFMTAYFCCIS